MDYKKISVIHPIEDPVTALYPALDFARRFKAQIDVLILSLADYPSIASVYSQHTDWSQKYGDLLAEIDTREKDVITFLAVSNVPFTVHTECTSLSLIDNVVAKTTLCSDLVLFTNSRSSFETGLIGQAFEGALLDSAKPVVVLCGNQQQLENAPAQITIAWDAVPQAAKAVYAALPLLQRAQKIELLIVKKNSEDKDSIESANTVIDWLKCHDINCTINAVEREGRFVSHALADYLDSHPCDLMVMGAYGHSRVSEKLFAGATHVALTDMQVSLLLAH